MKSGNKSLSLFLFPPPVVWMFLVFLLIAFLSESQTPGELYAAGNEMYKSNQFENATEDYEKLISLDYQKPEIYYNLGNSYFKQNKIGKSILSFERGLKLTPGDEDLLYNLAFARAKAVDHIQPVPQLSIISWWQNFLRTFTSNCWSMAAIIFIWLALVAISVSLFLRKSAILNSVSIIFFIFSVGLTAIAFHLKSKAENSNEAITMVSNVFVKSAPDANAGNLFMIHEGTKLMILDQIGEWNKIKLEDGKVGWLEKGNFETI